MVVGWRPSGDGGRMAAGWRPSADDGGRMAAIRRRWWPDGGHPLILNAFARGVMKKAVLSVVMASLLFQAGQVSTASAPLAFFKNYFVTGDYVVGGTSLWRKGVGGVAVESIEVSGVPAGADVVAAFLYVQTAEVVQWSGIDHARFNGVDLGPGLASFAKALNWAAGTPPCWSVAWGGGRRLVTYRADVLRFLPIGTDGKTAANGVHEIAVPDDGVQFPDGDEGQVETGGMGPRAVGAGLVIVYRDSAMPLRSVVIQDGAFTKQAFATADLAVTGFYEAAALPAARLTLLVGDGRPYLSERLRVNGQAIATNPFASSAGPKWDNPTFANLPVAAGASGVGVQITPNGLLSDCLSFSTLVFSADVQDSDGDGLLDVWESSDPPVTDPHGQPLPNLKAMGADPHVRDLYVEIGYMYTEDDPSPDVGPPTYGGIEKPAHSHRPTHATVKLIGDALAAAPTGTVRLHADLGDDYPHGEADEYIIRGAGLARGGEAINELATVCTRGATDPPTVCQFSDYPGTVGWKTGFQFLRDEVLSGPAPLPGGEDLCDLPGAPCERRFDRNRKDIFRYGLFAHAVGLPKSEDPAEADFHVPRTNTGIGDFPGGDFMVTLGAFEDADGLPVGTPFMQASTWMHEHGHGFERRHGGDAFQPNCKPIYFSVMNYLYQLRGLLDDAGNPYLDFSREDFSGIAIDETSLFDGSLSLLPYRLGWYAPLETSYLSAWGTPVAKHCDGSPLLPTDPPMVRLDARTAAAAVDWKADAVVDATPFVQDVNFNGRTTRSPLVPEVLAGSNDWEKMTLAQTGARRSAGGLFFDSEGNPSVGPMSLDAGRGDLGRGDLGRGDLGRGDLGRGDLGRGDLGRGDLGRGDLGTIFGRGDLGRGDLGGGDLFVGDPSEPGGELDFETAVGLAKTPPTAFQACVLGETCIQGDTPLHRVRLDWTSPTVGAVQQYEVWRVIGSDLTPEAVAAATPVGVEPAVLGQDAYTLVDPTSLTNGQTYTYFSRATYSDGTLSDPSNVVTVVGVNDPPAAEDDAYVTGEDTPLAPAAPGVLSNDTDTDTDGGAALQAVMVSGPSHGALVLNANGSFVYTPAANYHGPDAFTYKATDGSAESAPATVNITVTSVNDAPAMSDIGPVTIDANGSTGALAFTITDDDLDSVIVSGASSNPSLVPHANIVFGGAGALRTVTVTPAPNQGGTATITVTVTDGGGSTASDSFVVTVNTPYTFKNVQNAPPPPGSTFKAGSTIPMKWAFKAGLHFVSSGHVSHTITVTGPLPGGPVRTFTNTDAGASWFRYSDSSKTWAFNLQTKDHDGKPFPTGLYNVTITPTTPGFPASGTFQIQLVK
jgi:VCBS repeat-containing protein